MPEVENKPKNCVQNRSPQSNFEGQDSLPLVVYNATLKTYYSLSVLPKKQNYR